MQRDSVQNTEVSVSMASNGIFVPELGMLLTLCLWTFLYFPPPSTRRGPRAQGHGKSLLTFEVLDGPPGKAEHSRTSMASPEHCGWIFWIRPEHLAEILEILEIEWNRFSIESFKTAMNEEYWTSSLWHLRLIEEMLHRFISLSVTNVISYICNYTYIHIT